MAKYAVWADPASGKVEVEASTVIVTTYEGDNILTFVKDEGGARTRTVAQFFRWIYWKEIG